VKIRIKDKETFRPGMSVTAEIETRSRTNVLCVPIQSVTTRLPKDTNHVAALNPTNAPPADQNSGTNTAGVTKPDRKPGDAAKPIEVAFLAERDKVRMVPVKRGISDENYCEIVQGLDEGQEVVSGGYKAISRDLEDGKKIKRGEPEKEKEKK
jgi:HlyD family secretion protein